jgi:hypothetical protein
MNGGGTHLPVEGGQEERQSDWSLNLSDERGVIFKCTIQVGCSLSMAYRLFQLLIKKINK